MRVIISAAGTGGHIYPAISIINKIMSKEKNSEILYIGTTNRMEKDIIPKLGIKYIGIDIYGFSKNILTSFKALIYMLKAKAKCTKIIKDFKPDIVIGVGGYVTVPVILSAHKLRIKTIIHEQNSIPGKANKLLDKYVDRICISMKKSKAYFTDYKTVYTGNPRGEEVCNAPLIKKSDVGFNNKEKLVLITTGSLGSSTVNNIIKSTIPLMKEKEYQVLFITGKSYYDEYKGINLPSNIQVIPYLENMPSVLKITDLIISRAGATILSEITALGIPSILIPSPYVPNNHQYYNAKELEDNNASVLIEEKTLTSEKLIATIDLILDDKKKYLNMKKAAKEQGVTDSASRIYEEIIKIVSD